MASGEALTNQRQRAYEAIREGTEALLQVAVDLARPVINNPDEGTDFGQDYYANLRNRQVTGTLFTVC